MKKQLFILSFALLSLSSAMATNLVVKPLSGADYRRELATIGKLVYHGDSLYLYDSFGTRLYREQLAKVQRVVYSEGGEPTTGMAETDDAGGAVRVFPNPTASVLIMEVRSPTSRGNCSRQPLSPPPAPPWMSATSPQAPTSSSATAKPSKSSSNKPMSV